MVEEEGGIEVGNHKWTDEQFECDSCHQVFKISSGNVNVPSSPVKNPDFRVACNLIAPELYNPCSTYLYPDGTLTKEGATIS